MKRIIILVAASLVLWSCSSQKYTQGKPHTCSFEKCPYKAYPHFPGVIHTGSKKIDRTYRDSLVWQIDRYHFIYPNASYDRLDTLARNTSYKCRPKAYMLKTNKCQQGKHIYYKHFNHWHKISSVGWSGGA